MSKDYYNTLGVSKSATKEEIKKAFYKLAHKYHPDKSGGDDKKFKEVNEAYQVLSDENKRAKYDQFGSGFENMGGGSYGQGQGFGGFDGFDFSNFSQGFGGGAEFDLNDIFSDFFGGNMGRNTRRENRRGRDISTEINISFSDSIFGINRKVLLNKTSTCDICNGSGAKEGTKMDTCKSCNGQGKIHEAKRTILGTISTTKICDTCNGAGKVPKEFCDKCHGKGVLRKEEEININIPAGIRDGEMIRMTGLGEEVFKGTTGDLYIKINVNSHPIWKREGIDLVTNLNLKLSDALLGMKYDLETLEGKIEVSIPAGVGINEILRIKGKGVPMKGKRGDILIKLNIKMPNKLSRKARELVEKLKDEGV